MAEGEDVADVCRAVQISEANRWRNQFGGLKADDAKRLRELEKAALKEIATREF